MKTTTIILIIVLLVVAAFALWIFYPWHTTAPGTGSGTSTGRASTTTMTSFDQNIFDGVISISFPSADFGLATNQTQILVHSNIPPCDSNFNYCLYYIGNAYQGTNFESSGIRIQKRTDLSTERLCLNTPPAGFGSSTLPNTSSSADTYSTSVFSNVGGAAAGHFAAGSLYRLFYRPSNSCYEFETRIGQADYGNYPSGTIQQFTPADEAAVQAEIHQILGTLTLPSNERTLLPAGTI